MIGITNGKDMIVPFSVTSNGTYSAPDGYAYSPVEVNVENNSIDDIIQRTISGSYDNSDVTVVGQRAFAYCSNLTDAFFSNALDIGSCAFMYCAKLSNISFPNVSTISSTAFGYCSRLTTASFPNLTTVESFAFRSCTRLISLYLTGSSVVTLASSDVFMSTPIGRYITDSGQYGSVYVPASLLTNYKNNTVWNTFSLRLVGI